MTETFIWSTENVSQTAEIDLLRIPHFNKKYTESNYSPTTEIILTSEKNLEMGPDKYDDKVFRI